MFGRVRPCSAVFGRVRPCSAVFGHREREKLEKASVSVTDSSIQKWATHRFRIVTVLADFFSRKWRDVCASDFRAFRLSLQSSRVVGVYVPPLSGKKIRQNRDDSEPMSCPFLDGLIC